MIGPQELHWHIHCLNEVCHMSTSVVRGIINHENCVLPPVPVHGIQMLYQLDEKEEKGRTISFPLVNCEKSLTIATHSSNDVH